MTVVDSAAQAIVEEECTDDLCLANRAGGRLLGTAEQSLVRNFVGEVHQMA